MISLFVNIFSGYFMKQTLQFSLTHNKKLIIKLNKNQEKKK